MNGQNNPERHVSECQRCHRHRASRYIWCDGCWQEIVSEAHMDQWTPEQWYFEAQHLAHLLHLDAQPAQAVAR